MTQLLILLGGVALLFLAGWAVDAARGRRTRRSDLTDATARARRAIRLAETSRDAAPSTNVHAEQQLDRARALLSGVANAKTARRATALAERADKHWQLITTQARITGKLPGGTSTTGKRATPAHAPAALPIDRQDVVKVVCVLLLALIALIFISQQTQQASTVFTPRETHTAGAADDEPASAVPRQPTYEQVLAKYGDEAIITMDGATAVLDNDAAMEWMAKANAKAQHETDETERKYTEVVRIILAPPLHPDASDTIDVPANVLLVTGTRAALSPLVSEPSDFVGMERAYAAADVTSAVAALIANRIDEEPPDDVPLAWRAPTEQELADVLDDLQQNGIAFVGDVEPFSVPQTAYEAFPDEEPLIIVAGTSAAGVPAVNYADAVAEALPGRPVVGMTGLWLDFAGLHAAEFEDAMRASYYGQYARRMQQFDYPQRSILSLGLDRAAQFRHSGMFAQPLPYQAPDPLKLTMPALPWICGALGVAAVIASVVQIRRRPVGTPRPVDEQTVHRMAGLSELAVEISGLTDEESRPALVRALRALSEARQIADSVSEDAAVAEELLERAEQELTMVADQLQRPDYRPDSFLAARWT